MPETSCDRSGGTGFSERFSGSHLVWDLSVLQGADSRGVMLCVGGRGLANPSVSCHCFLLPCWWDPWNDSVIDTCIISLWTMGNSPTCSSSRFSLASVSTPLGHGHKLLGPPLDLVQVCKTLCWAGDGIRFSPTSWQFYSFLFLLHQYFLAPQHTVLPMAETSGGKKLTAEG